MDEIQQYEMAQQVLIDVNLDDLDFDEKYLRPFCDIFIDLLNGMKELNIDYQTFVENAFPHLPKVLGEEPEQIAANFIKIHSVDGKLSLAGRYYCMHLITSLLEQLKPEQQTDGD